MSGKRRTRQWLREHRADSYVRQARAAGYRSRAAFKLLELDRIEHLLHPGQCVLDLGAAPGGWTQVACQKVAPGGQVVAVDLLQMASVAGAIVVTGDFRCAEVMARIEHEIGPQGADLVISDMAPNLTGVKITDRAAAESLVVDALEIATQVLKPGATAVVKVFQGDMLDEAMGTAKRHFKKVRLCKPKASRARSSESYLLATGCGGILQ